jgi:hypothetical protein
MRALRRSADYGSRPKQAGLNSSGKEVPLQVMVSESVRRQLALMCADRGENIRTTVLRGLRAIGVRVDETELAERRGRRRKE